MIDQPGDLGLGRDARGRDQPRRCRTSAAGSAAGRRRSASPPGSASWPARIAKRRPVRECRRLWGISLIRSRRDSSGVCTAAHGVPADRERLRIRQHAAVRAHDREVVRQERVREVVEQLQRRGRLAGVGAGGEHERRGRRPRSRPRARARSPCSRTSSAGSARPRSCRERAASAAAAATRSPRCALPPARSRPRSRAPRGPRCTGCCATGAVARGRRASSAGVPCRSASARCRCAAMHCRSGRPAVAVVCHRAVRLGAASAICPIRTRMVGRPNASGARKRCSSGSRTSEVTVTMPWMS